MFHSVYPKSASYKETLRKKFMELCNEDTPIVRRAGARELGTFAAQVEKQHVINEILPIFRRLAQDEQDTIRIICMETLVPLAQYLTKEENQVNTLGAILAAGEDKNWKVRLSFAQNFAELSEAFGKEITDANLTQTFSNFLDDQEQEVKDAAMKSLAKCLKSFSPEKVTSYLLPTIQKLYEDASSNFKASLANALCIMPRECNLPKDVIISRILPIILDLIKDEDPDVRLNCSQGLINLADSIGTDLLSDSILTSLSQLTKDTQW